MDNRITIKEMHDLLSKEIERGNGNKTIQIQEYFIEKPGSDWETSGDQDVYSTGFNGIYFDDVEYSVEEQKYIDDMLEKHKLEHPELWDMTNLNNDIGASTHDEDIKNYFHYIVDRLNIEVNIDVETIDRLLNEVAKLKEEISDTKLKNYADYLIEVLNFKK